MHGVERQSIRLLIACAQSVRRHALEPAELRTRWRVEIIYALPCSCERPPRARASKAKCGVRWMQFNGGGLRRLILADQASPSGRRHENRGECLTTLKVCSLRRYIASINSLTTNCLMRVFSPGQWWHTDECANLHSPWICSLARLFRDFRTVIYDLPLSDLVPA